MSFQGLAPGTFKWKVPWWRMDAIATGRWQCAASTVNTKGVKDSVWRCLFLHRSGFILLDCNICFLLEVLRCSGSPPLRFWKPPAFFPCLVKPVLFSWPLSSFKPSHSHKCVSALLGSGEGGSVDRESERERKGWMWCQRKQPLCFTGTMAMLPEDAVDCWWAAGCQGVAQRISHGLVTGWMDRSLVGPSVQAGS